MKNADVKTLPIIPYRTKVRCTACGWVFKPRSTKPKQCPHCWKWDCFEVVSEFDLMKSQLRIKI